MIDLNMTIALVHSLRITLASAGRNMRLWLALVFSCLPALGCGLDLQVSQKDISWLNSQARRSFFSLLDYNKETTVAAVPQLLSSREHAFKFRRSYLDQKYPEETLKLLLHKYSKLPETHSQMLPFEMVITNDTMRKDLIPRLGTEYKPDIAIELQSLYGVPRSKHNETLKIFMENPMICPNKEILSKSLEANVPCAWMAYYGNFSQQYLRSLDPHFVLLDFWLHDKSVTKQTTCFTISTDIDSQCHDFLRASQQLSGPLYILAYREMLAIIGNKTSEMPRVIQSIWHCKLLIVATRELPIKCHSEESQKLFATHILEFFSTYGIKGIPPVILKILLEDMPKKSIVLPSGLNRDVLEELKILDGLYPRTPISWGSWDRYISRWRASLQLTYNSHESLPRFFSSWEKAIEWWGNFENPKQVLSPIFPAPVVVVEDDQTQVKYTHMYEFLEKMIQTLLNSDIFESTEAGTDIKMGKEEPEYFWAAVARTIVYSLFYFGEERMRLTTDIWKDICSAAPGEEWMGGMVMRYLQPYAVGELFSIKVFHENLPTFELSQNGDK